MGLGASGGEKREIWFIPSEYLQRYDLFQASIYICIALKSVSLTKLLLKIITMIFRMLNVKQVMEKTWSYL